MKRRTKANKKLMEENMGLAVTVANKWINSFEGYYTKEDLYNESFLALARATLVYKEDKGNFSPYCWFYIQSYLEHLYRKIKKMKLYNISMEQEIAENNNGQTFKIADIVKKKETYYEKFYDGEIEAITEAISKLKRKDQELIVAHYFEGFKKKEVAEMLGISSVWASNLYKKAERNLRILLVGEI